MSLLTFDDDVLAIAHHPTKRQFAVSLVTGHVSAFSYADANDEATLPKPIWATKRHRKACRAIAYSLDGTSLVSVGAEGVIKRAASGTGKVMQKWVEAHDETINVVSWVNDHVFCTGDDNGVIKAWDVRQEATLSEALRTFDATHEDYISSFLPLDEKFILSTSGDGTLAVHDLRASSNKKTTALVKRSDDQEDDLTCCVLLKQHSKKQKLCVGTSSGVISIFNRGDWGDCNDRILPPRSAAATSKRGKKGQAKKSAALDDEIGVECMAKVDENTLVVGGADGKIRLLEVLPNRWVRVIGDFENGEPVEDVLVNDGWVFAASGSELRRWSLEEQPTPEPVNTKDEQEQDAEAQAQASDKDESSDGDSDKEAEEKEKEKEKDEEDDDEDDDDGNQFSSDSDDEPKRKRPKKTRPIIQEKKNTFFDDL